MDLTFIFRREAVTSSDVETLIKIFHLQPPLDETRYSGFPPRLMISFFCLSNPGAVVKSMVMISIV